MPSVTIAFAEDHSLVRQGFVSLLNYYTEHTVIAEAENGEALIYKIRNLDMPPDICIVDINMPILNGYDTTLKLKKLYPNIKVLALTMFDEEYSIIRMIKNGANGYLLKGCQLEELKAAIDAIHISGYYYSKTASEKAFKIVRNNFLTTLKERELQFLRLCSSDIGYLKIAEIMNVSIRTVQDYQRAISEKLHIKSRIGLVLFAVQTGLVSINKH